MKHYSMILAILLTLCVCCTAFAADDWAPFEADLSEAEALECRIVEASSSNEEYKAILGEVTEDDWSIGPEDAILTLVEYADFQCPYCSRAGLAAIEFQASHPDEVRYVYRHFPLSFHEKAPMAAYAADAAGKQGFFFDAESFLYANQSEWTDLEELDAFDAYLRENLPAAIEGLDADQWVVDYESAEIREKVDGAFDAVAATGIVGGTPSFYANFYEASMDTAELENFISLFKLQSSYRSTCPVQSVEEGKEYRAVVHTDAGDFVINLFADKAPALVSNFIDLALDGWYNGNTFHNVNAGVIAQSGDPSASGVGIAGYTLADENLNSGAFSEPGAVAMANNGADTNSSQFFFAGDLQQYFEESSKVTYPDLDAEAIAVKATGKVAKLDARYSVIGKLDEASLALLPGITAETVINSIDIEVK